MLTVAFYNFIIYSATFFLWLSEKIKNKTFDIFFVIFSFFIIFIPAALRYEVGTDYQAYVNLYNNFDYDSRLEIGFKILNSFLHSLDFKAEWAIASYAFIFSFAAYLGLPKSYKWLYLFVFLLTIWLPSLNITRQAIAISFSMLAFKYLWEKKFILFLIIILIGSSIHQSILLLIPLAVVAFFANGMVLSKKIIIFLMHFVIIIALLFPTVFFIPIEKALVFLNLNSYAAYFGNSTHFIETGGSNIIVLSKISFVIFAIGVLSKKTKENYAYRYIVLAFFIYGLSMALSAHIVIFSRMSFIFSFCLICGIPIIMSELRLNIFSKIIIIMFILILMTSFLKDSFGIPTEYSDPQLNPYKSFLFLK